ncbi:MAG TPA: hypothetical protein VG937_02145 [Polyangiaceae bacterium]|nr:hypothetical protein [Polyangiaceae bacterium]
MTLAPAFGPSVAHVIGLPRPIEATLSHDGVGGVRIARFERGLEFREVVSESQVERRLSFAISAEPAPTAALDEHVAVGGPYFGVLDGTYELEPLAERFDLTEACESPTPLHSFQLLRTRLDRLHHVRSAVGDPGGDSKAL